MPVLVATLRRWLHHPVCSSSSVRRRDDAPDGATALSRCARKYGLVISDWNMEPMTGYELLKQVRADPALGPVPFIMVTAESKTENVLAAKKAGVKNYIVKPFNAQTLQSKIQSVFPDSAAPPLA
jgi:two-component system chemotaxis response regulator CheY